ncbi:UNVERIFIED_CONTAM: hypothetical protein Slati_0502700 [Sesamum latifolium]|uniref:Uncharacterized protein n=1 Tax=Sesamum latifolium TaxID=2727402 RepID=A0AAW2XXP7_9LAMI
MFSTDESIRYIGENPGEDPSEATSKRSCSNPPSCINGRRWSLRQVAFRLLDESSEEEEGGDEEEEGSSPGEVDPDIRDNKVLPGTRGSRPLGSACVPCCLCQSNIYQLVEEFGIPLEFVISVPPLTVILVLRLLTI